MSTNKAKKATKSKRTGVPLHVYVPPELMARVTKRVEVLGYPHNLTSVTRSLLDAGLAATKEATK